MYKRQVLFDGKWVGKGQQLDGLQNVGDLFGQAGGDLFLDVLQDALLDLALVLHRTVQRVQRSVDAFQRPLFQNCLLYTSRCVSETDAEKGKPRVEILSGYGLLLGLNLLTERHGKAGQRRCV